VAYFHRECDRTGGNAENHKTVTERRLNVQITANEPGMYPTKLRNGVVRSFDACAATVAISVDECTTAHPYKFIGGEGVRSMRVSSLNPGNEDRTTLQLSLNNSAVEKICPVSKSKMPPPPAP
jgi:hypothetical protein